MNNNVKILIGAAVGASIGWFTGRVIVEVIYMKENKLDYDETIEFDPKLNLVKETGELLDIGSPRETRTKKETKMGKKKQPVAYDKIYENKPELVAFIKKYNDTEGGIPNSVDEIEEPLEDITGEEIEQFALEMDENKDIQIIDQQTYLNNSDGYKKVNLLYFADDILTTDNEIPLDRPERFLGDDALDSFNGEDAVYVCNTIKKAMYCITRVEGEYASPESRRGGKHKGMRKVDYDEENPADPD